MKKYLLLLFFMNCATTKEIPPPLKGSFENPLKIKNQAIIQCFENFKSKNRLEILYIETLVGIDFHLVDKFSFPYKKWIKNLKKIDLLKDFPNEYFFFIDQYHDINECDERSIEELIEFPE